jgi:NTP pyrophosphatase (non-canonical NTP hydrolase)
MAETAASLFDRLITIMRTLRSPEGCPWDRQQTLQSLRPYLLEETYEALEAIDRNDDREIQEELGDLLFEIVFLAQIGEETARFSLAGALASITDKLVRRSTVAPVCGIGRRPARSRRFRAADAHSRECVSDCWSSPRGRRTCAHVTRLPAT